MFAHCYASVFKEGFCPVFQDIAQSVFELIRGKAARYGVVVCSKILSGFMNVVSDVAD